MKFSKKSGLQNDAQWHGLVVDGKFLKIGTDETIVLSHIKSISFSKESYRFLYFHIILFLSSIFGIFSPQRDLEMGAYIAFMCFFAFCALCSFLIGLNSRLMISLTGSSKINIFESRNEASVRAIKSSLEDAIASHRN